MLSLKSLSLVLSIRTLLFDLKCDYWDCLKISIFFWSQWNVLEDEEQRDIEDEEKENTKLDVDSLS
jgi:hypothetical protein